MASIAQIVEQIRTAVYGKDVRENIAQGIEQCYGETAQISVAKISGTADDYKATLTQSAGG